MVVLFSSDVLGLFAICFVFLVCTCTCLKCPFGGTVFCTCALPTCIGFLCMYVYD